MKSLVDILYRRRRAADKGAILLVVLIVMVALLGLGMTGLFLTSGSIQMNTNINLRNQALVVAEAGVERARGILNNRTTGWVPPVPSLLAGTGGDEIPANPADCEGSVRGAILIDQITPSCTTIPTPGECILKDRDYPSVDRSSDLPTSAGSVARTTMGKYTVYIRQDQADCRMGNYTCDYAREATGIDAGVGGAGGTTGLTTCTVPANIPPPNGSIVIRSEGLASDGRTRVVLEVTMSPGQGGVQAQNSPMSALCSAGASGCDDNTSVQNGIVVNSPAPEKPPVSSGGAPSAGGAGGAGGGTTVPVTGNSGGAPGTGGAATGGVTGTGGATGTGGSTLCPYDKCKVVATIGIQGAWDITWGPGNKSVVTDGNVFFNQWLAAHSSSCKIQNNFDLSTVTITPELLAPLKIIYVLDLYHTRADRDAFIAGVEAGTYTQWCGTCYTGSQRSLLQSEVDAIKDWVNNGGGLATTLGYRNSWDEPANVNRVLRPYGVTYSTTDTWLFAGKTLITTFSHIPPIASALTNGVSTLQVNNVVAIKGWVAGAEGALPPESSHFANFSSQGGYTMGAALLVPPYTATSGRILMWSDEWITYDQVWGDTSQQADVFWNNSLNWLAGNCTP
jgi:hypothetical protein